MDLLGGKKIIMNNTLSFFLFPFFFFSNVLSSWEGVGGMPCQLGESGVLLRLLYILRPRALYTVIWVVNISSLSEELTLRMRA
jgi:hypothetical protein